MHVLCRKIRYDIMVTVTFELVQPMQFDAVFTVQSGEVAVDLTSSLTTRCLALAEIVRKVLET